MGLAISHKIKQVSGFLFYLVMKNFVGTVRFIRVIYRKLKSSFRFPEFSWSKWQSWKTCIVHCTSQSSCRIEQGSGNDHSSFNTITSIGRVIGGVASLPTETEDPGLIPGESQMFFFYVSTTLDVRLLIFSYYLCIHYLY